MKAEDKKLIYTLLKTADAYECSFTRPQFAAEPEFTDDTENPVVDSQETSIQPAASSTTCTPETTEASGGLTLDELNAKILRCTRCGLARTRNNVVPGMGVEHPDVLVIGEGPGQDEDMQGLPFVGKAGILLDRMLAAIGLDRKTNCYIANIVKCRPPENRNPMPDEQAACCAFIETLCPVIFSMAIFPIQRIIFGFKI